jgi:ribosomal protein L32
MAVSKRRKTRSKTKQKNNNKRLKLLTLSVNKTSDEVHIRHHLTNKVLEAMNYPNCTLSSESYNMNVDNNLQTTLNFRGWDTNP